MINKINNHENKMTFCSFSSLPYPIITNFVDAAQYANTCTCIWYIKQNKQSQKKLLSSFEADNLSIINVNAVR